MGYKINCGPEFIGYSDGEIKELHKRAKQIEAYVLQMQVCLMELQDYNQWYVELQEKLVLGLLDNINTSTALIGTKIKTGEIKDGKGD